MQLVINITETPRGDADIQIKYGSPNGKCTAKEKAYVDGIMATLKFAIPLIGKQLGCTDVISGEGPRKNN